MLVKEREELQREDICGVIVTYNPDKRLKNLISQIVDQVDSVVIVDNNSTAEMISLEKIINKQQKVYLLRNDKNLGIATALNQGVCWAKSRGYSWVLTFDQDTLIKKNMVEHLIDVYYDFKQDYEADKLAVIGSNFYNLSERKIKYDYNPNDESKYIEKKTVITSGSLIPVRVFNKVGPFRDEFFIDQVDVDFCLRAKHKGFKVILACKPLMLHTIGSRKTLDFILKKINRYIHSNERMYFILRNSLILIEEYAIAEPTWTLTKFLSLLCTFFLNKRKNDKWSSRIKYAIWGFLDGLTHNFDREII